jgi:hypothetical protein
MRGVRKGKLGAFWYSFPIVPTNYRRWAIRIFALRARGFDRTSSLEGIITRRFIKLKVGTC